jgi:predicted dehydrogenase
MLNIGFVGLGGMGMGQVKSFAQVKGCRIAAGADPSPEAQAKFKEQFPDAEVLLDYKALLRKGKVDALVVVTPTLYHKDVCIAAMRSGRPVLTEKPMARTVADAQKMIDVSEKTRKLLMVAHCRRFDTDWGAWGRLVTSGRIGRPVLFRHCNANLITFGGPWFMDHKLSGGPLMDGAIHNYDFGNHLFGDPEEVIASEIKLTKKSAIDTGTAVVRYKSGDQIMVCWSWGVTSSHLIDVLGPKGSINWGSGDLPTDQYEKDKHGFYVVADPLRQKKKLVAFKRTNMYVAQAKHFVDCIAGKARCVIPGTEAIKAVAVAETILKAAPKGEARKVRW